MFVSFFVINFLFFKHVAFLAVASDSSRLLFVRAMTMIIGVAAPQSNWFVDNSGAILTAAVTLVGTVITGLTTVKAARGGAKSKSRRVPGKSSYNRHAKQYRQSIQRIAQVKVLGFSEPFSIEHIYVQPRVYKHDVFQYKNDDQPFDLAQQSQAGIPPLQQELEVPKEQEPEMAIQEFRYCVIVGEPGVGKTTLLKYLMLRSARRELVELGLPDIPLYVELSTAVSNEPKSLLDLLVTQWEHYAQVPADIARLDLEQAIKDGKVLLLLDGLDETAVGSDSDQAKETYRRILQLIQSFVDTHDKLYVVVTARKAMYSNHSLPYLRSFTELEIARLTPDAITRFVENYFNASDPSSSKQMVKSFITVLKRDKSIEQLAANPLLLLLIVLVYRQNRVLPGKKAELYERCIELLLRSWDAPKYTTTNRVRAFPPTSKNEDKLLAKIAWHLHVEGRSYFPRQKVLNIIAEFLLTLNPTPNMAPEKDGEILELMVSTHNLIVEKSPGNYGFSHLTFQEYFVALYVRDNSLSNILLDNIDKSWWEEVLLLYASLASDASPLLYKLLERGEGNNPTEKLCHVSLLLAGHCLETATFLERTLRKTILDRLCLILETTPYAYLQGEIADIMVRVGDIGRLLNLLKKPGIEANLARNITIAMGYSNDSSLLRSLFDLLQSKGSVDSSYVRAHIALLIGKIGAQIPQNVSGRLLDLLTESSNGEWYVLLKVADALGELGDPTLAPALVQMFLDPDNSPIYYRLAITLGKLGNSAIIPELFDLLLRKDSYLDEYAQGRIIIALRMMVNQEVIKFFMRLLQRNDVSIYVRCQIARAFTDIKRTDVPVKDLLNILSDPAIDLEVRGELAATCCKLRAYSDSVIPILLKYLSCKVPDRNIHIVDVLSSLNYLPNATILDPLYQQLKDPGLAPDQRGNILAILAMVGVDDRAHEIVQFVKNQSFLHVCSKVQINVILALGYLGQRNRLRAQEIIELLLKLVRQKDLNPYVGRGITEALNMLKPQNYIPDLLDLLDDHDTIDAYVRQGIAQIISQCELNDIEQQKLLQLLDSTDIPNDVFEALMNCSH